MIAVPMIVSPARSAASARRIMIVSPHFPPTNAADMHRVRLTLPFYRELGWQSEILAVEPEQVAAPQDPWLFEMLPSDVPVHRVRGLGLEWSRIPGLGTLDFRALLALRRGGDHILAHQRFDLIYFSTTAFPVHILGPHWARTWGVPFVMDYQDPWITSYYQQHRDVVPPGGRLKYAVVNRLGRWAEPYVLRRCAGITSVSEEYTQQLLDRYAFAAKIPSLVVPFPGAERDLREAAKSGVEQSYFDPCDGNTHWVCVGVSGRIMYRTLRAIFRALQIHGEQQPEFLDKLKIHFIGTSYAPPGTAMPVVAPIAREYGLDQVVSEWTDRIPYSQAIRCLQDAHALIVPGTDDAGYLPSKLLPYLLARKPLLAVLHHRSPGVELLRQLGGAIAIAFSERDSETSLAERVRDDWLNGGVFGKTLTFDEDRMFPHTDRGCAARLCAFFDRVVAGASSPLLPVSVE